MTTIKEQVRAENRRICDLARDVTVERVRDAVERRTELHLKSVLIIPDNSDLTIHDYAGAVSQACDDLYMRIMSILRNQSGDHR